MKRENQLERWATIGVIILLGGGVFCTLILLYFFYHYAITGQRQFTSPVAAVPYYYVPAALATLLFAALQLERSQRINLAILCVSFAVSIYAGELFLTFTDAASLAARPIWGGDQVQKRKHEVRKLAREFGVEFDTRTKLEVIRDLRARGIDAVPSITPQGLLRKQEDGSMTSAFNIDGNEVLPLGGVSHRVTVFCNETGEYLIYKSDEHGFHNPKGIWQLDRLPIVAVGDSFSLGGCVSSDKGFVALIRNRYPGTLNLSMAGEGPLTMLAALKEYAPAVEPRTVLWFYYEENDIEDLKEEEQSPLLMRYLGNDFSQNLLSRQDEIDKAVLAHIEGAMIKELAEEQQEVADGAAMTPKVMAIAKLSKLRQKLGLALGTHATEKSRSSAATEAELELFQTVLSQAKATVAGWGGKLYFVYLPAWQRYGNLQAAGKSAVKYHDRVLSLVKKLGIPIIDVHPAFQAQNDPLSLFSFRRFGHYNAQGHRVVAEEVLRVISPEG